MRRLSILFSLLVAVSAVGCSHKSKPKPNPDIAAEVEEGFKSRWIAKRMGELQASGQATDPREARRIAVEEFRKKYPFTSAAEKSDPMGGEKP